MTILYTISSLEIGGAEIFLARLSRYLIEIENCQVFVFDFEQEKRDVRVLEQFSHNVQFVHNPYASKFLRRLIEKTEKIFRLDKDKITRGLYRHLFRKIIATHQIELIHSHLFRSDRVVARLDLNLPLITTLHGCYNYYDHQQAEAIFPILNAFKKIIYITERNLLPFQKMKKGVQLLEKSRRIYNGISLVKKKKIQRADEGVLKVLVLSRCIREKGWELLIKAVTALNKSGENVQLHLVGDGEFLPYLKGQYEHLPFLFFHGMQSMTDPFIAAADVCCFPSLYANESLPNSILEYMLHAKPVIASRLGDIPVMMHCEDETCGFIAVENASENDLQKFFEEKIKTYLYDPSLIAKHGSLAFECVQKFDLKNCANSYLQVYREAR